MKYNYVKDIKKQFRYLKKHNMQSKDTYEIQCASFIADEPTIFGDRNEAYIGAELEWYKSQSLNVNDIELYYGMVPKIWKSVADPEGFINSNYGWCIFSGANGHQYNNARDRLWDNPDTRHAVMYYTRPTMHQDASFNGMKDHMCTFAVQYHMHQWNIDAHVYMRSNDAIFGYNNDYAWQEFVLQKLCTDMSHAHRRVKPGKIHWNASSLHIYPRHWDLIK